MESLDTSCNFAQAFNQELDLRQKLWHEGFMSDLQQLPGLIRQERDSLTTYLKIMFQLHFHPKEGQSELFAPNTVSERLFDMCCKVIKNYIKKQEDYTVLNKARTDGKEESDVPEATIHEQELERQLLNLTPLISDTILPNLSALTDDDVSYIEF